MTQEYNSVFDELMSENENQTVEGLVIEPALIIDDANKTYYPGINIEASRFNGPLFISVDELRRLADEADEIANKAMNKN